MSATDGLCCCEYENLDGERSHILACCCDCDALDQIADRCFKCEKIPDGMVQRFFNTLNDRCRFPGICGKGAVRMNLDIVAPCCLVVASIYISTYGPYTTFFMLTLMPVFMLSFYYLWRKNTQMTRTQFFYSWGLTSVVLMFLVFHIYTICFRKTLLWEHILLFTAFSLMIFFFIKTKKSPSILRHGIKDATRVKSSKHVTVNLENNTHDRVDDILSQEIAEKDVTWVDSRPIKDGKLKIWCENCHFKKPARSGHCNICNACISVRDHHCVWIDCCIGSHNHRSFIMTMALFLFCGFYGFHLTMTTVCTPEMYLGWFLFPSDCRFLYIDFQTAVSFVAACYTLMASILMLCNFIYQIVLISQNTTSQEFHQASRRGLRTKCFTVKNNIHNNGFIKNWIAFIFTRREDTGNIP
ncbi:palmitoyltransferase ZDHHC23-like [Mytilus trossulus]|uniref:palmitoyltransferase ZDHHC23-like n=1 Tax=Mytilus trossulus TaxID=6551 RepID=UPI0030046FA1